MPPNLALEIDRHRLVRGELLARWPLLADDEETLNDTLEGISSLSEAIATVLRSAVEDRMLADGLALHIARLQARKKRIEERAGRKRSLALWACQEAQIERIAAPDLSAHLTMGKGHVVITDEKMLGDAWWRVRREPDKAKIGEALRAGLLIDGAELSNPSPALTIRTT